jgi:DNA adenine methylase
MSRTLESSLFDTDPATGPAPLSRGLLKWIGNKQRYAMQIVAQLPDSFGCYFEPFVGSAAVLATLRPKRALGSDTFAPVIEIWQAVRNDPQAVKGWYRERYDRFSRGAKRDEYEVVKAAYNRAPNGADLLFLCRSCYAGVVRFRKADGYMSTPCGPHNPISPESFDERVDEWHRRIHGATFERLDYRDAMTRAKAGDVVYCDPPYAHSQTILYGAQGFRLEALLEEIERCKRRGVRVALSIDGHKKSGERVCDLPIPPGLFQREILIDCGRSMLRRLQMEGQTLENERVSDRLLLTY